MTWADPSGRAPSGSDRRAPRSSASSGAGTARPRGERYCFDLSPLCDQIGLPLATVRRCSMSPAAPACAAPPELSDAARASDVPLAMRRVLEMAGRGHLGARRVGRALSRRGGSRPRAPSHRRGRAVVLVCQHRGLPRLLSGERRAAPVAVLRCLRSPRRSWRHEPRTGARQRRSAELGCERGSQAAKRWRGPLPTCSAFPDMPERNLAIVENVGTLPAHRRRGLRRRSPLRARLRGGRSGSGAPEHSLVPHREQIPAATGLSSARASPSRRSAGTREFAAPLGAPGFTCGWSASSGIPTRPIPVESPPSGRGDRGSGRFVQEHGHPRTGPLLPPHSWRWRVPSLRGRMGRRVGARGSVHPETEGSHGMWIGSLRAACPH